MNCEYFGKCASCTLYNKTYKEQLEYKINIEKTRFKDFLPSNFEVYESEEQNFRYKAEFRLWKSFTNDNKLKLSYAMIDFDKKALEINTCHIVSLDIKELMPKLLACILEDDILSFKLYGCEFLNSTKGETILTLIYHKKLDAKWIEKAKDLELKLNIKIVGRSKKQKLVLSDDYINEVLSINNKDIKYIYKENAFSQANTKVNIKMIEWIINNATLSNDLCELYCGSGNFTIALSPYFRKVLATEISKTSIQTAKINCELNAITNIKFARLSSQEFAQAYSKERKFRRLEDINVDISSYDFSSILVDPPRIGLDNETIQFIEHFEQIIYISCNTLSLYENLLSLSKNYNIKHFAFFDQFAYTKHIETIIILEKKAKK